MARYIPITGIDCKIPCVLIDSEAPSTCCTAPRLTACAV